MLGPFDPTTLSAGIVTNFAYDILKNRSLSSNNTLVGRMMRWAGLRTATFEERLRDTLTKTSALLIKEQPDFANEAVASFLREPEVARQIGDHILDRLPLDEQQLQQLFHQHVQHAHSASRILLQRKGITEQRIITAFLSCYRRVLSEQLSIPEMGILLDMLDMSMQTIQELKNSEERTKEHISALLDTKLSTTALQIAYQTGQQQIISAATDLIIPEQAAQAKRNRTMPALFTDGLCKGRQLHPAADRYFVAHGFDQKKLADWRQILTDALARINHASQPLQPYFSGDTLLGGFRLCSICERLYSTNFSLFLLPATQDRNVYLELGIAIGLGQPFLLIREHAAPIPQVLTSLSFYTQGGSLRSMRRELAGQVEEYDFGAVQFLKDVSDVQVQPHYVIAAGELFIEWTLEKEGYTCIFHPLENANRYSVDIAPLLRQTKHTIILLSPDYLQNLEGYSEKNALLYTARSLSRMLFPVQVKKCDLRQLIRDRTIIDFTKLNKVSATRRVQSFVERIRTTSDSERPKVLQPSEGRPAPPFPRDEKRVHVFISYSRKDEVHMYRLLSHLQPLQRQGLITIWNDKDIPAGTDWQKEIDIQLNRANIILLLVSADFLASKYISSVEIERAMSRREQGARVIPIILSPCLWQISPLSDIQPLPTNAKPITTWADTDQAFFDVALGIRQVVEELQDEL